MILEGLLYAESHEWLKVEGKKAYVGISDHAQHALGSVVFIELPKVGSSIKKGDTFGAVESVKAASDLYMPVTGKILEVNSKLEVTPELLNDDPYGSWIIKIELSNASETSTLLTSAKYAPLCEE
jgi:glycine cleavage system H protein